MRMTPDEREVIASLLRDAHAEAMRPDGSTAVRAVPAIFLRLLREAEGINPTFVGAYIDALALKGAAKVLADWRRTQRTQARTAKGTPLDVPAFAGVRRADHDGNKVPVQVALPGMTVEELRGHKDRLSASRNTLSREIRLLSDLIEVMEANGYQSAGEALDHLMRAAS